MKVYLQQLYSMASHFNISKLHWICMYCRLLKGLAVLQSIATQDPHLLNSNVYKSMIIYKLFTTWDNTHIELSVIRKINQECCTSTDEYENCHSQSICFKSYSVWWGSRVVYIDEGFALQRSCVDFEQYFCTFNKWSSILFNHLLSEVSLLHTNRSSETRLQLIKPPSQTEHSTRAAGDELRSLFSVSQLLKRSSELAPSLKLATSWQITLAMMLATWLSFASSSWLGATF